MPHYNLHQHSMFSDGKAKPEAYVKKAVEFGFSAVGFSEHSPLPFATTFSLKKESIDSYIKSIETLKQKYKDKIDIYRSLEMDFIPKISDNFDCWRKKVQCDYLIGSVHLVKPEYSQELWFIDGHNHDIYDNGIIELFYGDIKKAVTRYYHQNMEMIESQNFEILGHFDKITMHNRNRFFSDDDKWYQRLVDEILELVKQKGLFVEVNTRGLYKKRSDKLFPDGLTLQKVKNHNIPVLISTDAHQPDEIALFADYAKKRLLKFGFQTVMYFDNGIWKEQTLI